VARRDAGRGTWTNPISGAIDGYEFQAETRFDRLFSEVALERPTAIGPHDRTGCEGIGVEDTFDADYRRLSENVAM
jgi:hypothetical protein